jgi:uncharacterized protein (DUF362 family)
MQNTDRRFFLKTGAAATACSSVLPKITLADDKKPTIYVVHGTDVKKMLKVGIEKMGGWAKYVKKGKKATIKPNAAWASTPEQGGNTDPVLVGECITACKTEGASEIIVPENTCSPHKKSFKMSGIGAAVTKAGGKIYRPEKAEHFKTVKLPEAKLLKEANIAVDVIDTECLINIPIAKDHRMAVLTISMKNWMGSIDKSVRDKMHREGLDQGIVDLNTFIKPALIIIDATRIMLTNGPRGPGKLDHPNKLIFGTDTVACDAYTATLFKKEPFDIPHIKMAHDAKIGCGDIDKINVVHVDA